MITDMGTPAMTAQEMRKGDLSHSRVFYIYSSSDGCNATAIVVLGRQSKRLISWCNHRGTVSASYEEGQGTVSTASSARIGARRR